ncbi:MAG: PAS domain S-box protein, partial [Oxalobacteraceae bacterium]
MAICCARGVTIAGALPRMETAETHAWLLTLIEGMPQMIWRAVGHGSWTWSSPQWQHYTGQTPQQSQDDGWLVVVHPDDREAGRRAWAQVDQQNIFHVDLRIRGLDGTYRWFQTRALPATGPEGAITEWIGTSTDIDDLRRLQAEQKVLVGELQHRTRNLIAVVHGIALQTVHGSASLDDFQDRFEDRLEALSRVQGLLSHSQHEPITIGTLVELELSALAGSEMQDQITLEGADVTIRETAAQTLALAIHELSTNALKYGALSSSAGKLAIRWYEHGNADDQSLRLDWTESGLPQVAHGAGRVGYGRVLIEQSLPQQAIVANRQVND